MDRLTLLGWSIALATLPGLLGCGHRPAGPLDARLLGVWESRRGFVGTDTLDFRDDGTLRVTTSDGQQEKSYTAQWYVAQPGAEPLKLSMQAQGKKEFRVRHLSFRDDGSFEMREGNNILGRFERQIGL
jgi:hypothetical protein